jgi:transcriptional regulator with XRE-family HTH domain
MAVACHNGNVATNFPVDQRELIRLARGEMSQADFARLAGVGRTALCKYERQTRGVPLKFLNYCLKVVASQLDSHAMRSERATTALAHARHTVNELEALAADMADGPT